MKLIWLDRDGYVEKTETMTAKQAALKVEPLLGSVSQRLCRYCAAVSMEDRTLTIYSRGGSWCREHRDECRGKGCQ